MKGEAEAFALEAKGRAEAEQMAKKAEAFKQYKDGAMVDMLLEKLPLVSLAYDRVLSLFVSFNSDFAWGLLIKWKHIWVCSHTQKNFL